MTLLALELVALITLFAVDDVAHHRAAVSTWALSFKVIAASALAVALVTWLQATTGGDIF